jgi:hypothetical protein
MGDPRSENWCYGCPIDCRSITIAINHPPLLPHLLRSVLNSGTRADGVQCREFAIGRERLVCLASRSCA